MKLGVLQTKENINDVCLGVELRRKQQNEIIRVLGKRKEILTDILGKTSIIEHRVHILGDRPIRCRPYALPYAVRDEIQEEIQEIIVYPYDSEIVRKSNSLYALPMVVVKKKARSNHNIELITVN